MNILTFLLNDLNSNLRNKTQMIVAIVMPIMMVCLMGFALKTYFTPGETPQISKFDVLYSNEDTGLYGQIFDMAIKNPSQSIMNPVVKSRNEIQDALKADKNTVGIIIGSDFSKNIEAGYKANVELYGIGNDPLKDPVMQTFTFELENIINNRANLIANYEKLNIKDKQTQLVDTIFQEVTSTQQNAVSLGEVQKPKNHELNSYQYFSASMLIFFLLNIGIGLGVSILSEREMLIFKRIKSHPVTTASYLIGKTIANIILGLIQATALIAFTTIVFNVDWSANYLEIFGIVVLMTLISSGIAVILTNFISSSKALATMLTVIYWVMTFISGGFMELKIFSKASWFTVNKMAFEGITNIMLKDNFSQTLTFIGFMALVAAVLWIVGFALYTRRVAYE